VIQALLFHSLISLLRPVVEQWFGDSFRRVEH
jgi:hypothetical protein